MLATGLPYNPSLLPEILGATAAGTAAGQLVAGR